jgi:hypothetical protein
MKSVLPVNPLLSQFTFFVVFTSAEDHGNDVNCPVLQSVSNRARRRPVALRLRTWIDPALLYYRIDPIRLCICTLQRTLSIKRFSAHLFCSYGQKRTFVKRNSQVFRLRKKGQQISCFCFFFSYGLSPDDRGKPKTIALSENTDAQSS